MRTDAFARSHERWLEGRGHVRQVGEPEGRALGHPPGSPMFFCVGGMRAGERRGPPELDGQGRDFSQPSRPGAARLVSGVQSPQDAQEVAHGLERERIRI
jgi:hypothetical protein